jgi:hypothetical protein
MIENIFSKEELVGLARRKSNEYEIRAMSVLEFEKAKNEGWEEKKL